MSIRRKRPILTNTVVGFHPEYEIEIPAIQNDIDPTMLGAKLRLQTYPDPVTKVRPQVNTLELLGAILRYCRKRGNLPATMTTWINQTAAHQKHGYDKERAYDEVSSVLYYRRSIFNAESNQKVQDNVDEMNQLTTTDIADQIIHLATAMDIIHKIKGDTLDYRQLGGDWRIKNNFLETLPGNWQQLMTLYYQTSMLITTKENALRKNAWDHGDLSNDEMPADYPGKEVLRKEYEKRKNENKIDKLKKEVSMMKKQVNNQQKAKTHGHGPQIERMERAINQLKHGNTVRRNEKSKVVDQAMTERVNAAKFWRQPTADTARPAHVYARRRSSLGETPHTTHHVPSRSSSLHVKHQSSFGEPQHSPPNGPKAWGIRSTRSDVGG
jgi:hypothetical protein